MSDKERFQQWVKDERERGLLSIHMSLIRLGKIDETIYTELMEIINAPQVLDTEIF